LLKCKQRTCIQGGLTDAASTAIPDTKVKTDDTDCGEFDARPPTDRESRLSLGKIELIARVETCDTFNNTNNLGPFS